MAQTQNLIVLKKRVGYRIGLALSGGGYRASLFHLGVIRRLEELGIMQDVSVISCVSGGSIIGAFYATEMEQRLRSRRDQIASNWPEYDNNLQYDKGKENRIKLKIAKIRLEIFEEIAEKFFVAMDKNMRMRATLFAPFFHISGVKALFSKSYTRAELIQLEYDKWFFHKGVVDFLPSYHIITEKDFKERRESQTGYKLRPGYHVYKTNREIRAQLGTKVIINATSLLNGENKSFYRIPIWGFSEMTKVNKNVEKLSKIVGASSAVPGAFPPAVIGGDVLVDGGVSDNQGLHLFLGEEQKEEHHATSSELYEECDILLVSDASGQMLKIDQMDRTEIPVLVRTQGIQSFELRNRNIDLLVKWRRRKRKGKKERLFAFVHLYRSLKDREEFVGQNRVPSEYISALGGIRTDLDQFSHIEREALMYHGYTLIDNQLREWCRDFLEDRGLDCQINSKKLNQGLTNKVASVQRLRKPPLFRETKIDKWQKNIDKSTKLRKYREKIKNHLEVGNSMLLTKRLFKDHRVPVLMYYTSIMVGILYLALSYFSYIQINLSPRIIGYLSSLIASVIPGWLRDIFVGLVEAGVIAWPITPFGMNLLATLFVLAVSGYLIIGFTYKYFGQPISIVLDKRLYKQLTGKNLRKEKRTHWEEAPKTDKKSDDLLDFRICTQQSFRWPEAIDIDSDGTLYFSDLGENALYRIGRYKGDNRLKKQAERLIFGFQHISGISIDKDAGFLYLGARTREDKKSNWVIIKFPLEIFDSCAENPKSFIETKTHFEKKGITIQEIPIDGQPNGVRFRSKVKGGEIFYTSQRMFAIFGDKGYLGSTSEEQDKISMVTPNGIDVDPSTKDNTLVISQFRKNAIARVSLANQKIDSTYKIKLPKALLGSGPDGLICMKNDDVGNVGDVLVAAFWRGEILYLAFDGSSYAMPVIIAKDLNNPTDLVIGPSSDGQCDSLYVTTTKLWRALLPSAWKLGGGKVVEIPNIKNKVENARSAAVMDR